MMQSRGHIGPNLTMTPAAYTLYTKNKKGVQHLRT